MDDFDKTLDSLIKQHSNNEILFFYKNDWRIKKLRKSTDLIEKIKLANAFFFSLATMAFINTKSIRETLMSDINTLDWFNSLKTKILPTLVANYR